jgi:uncharacterized protein YcbK (DUF882 family)
MRWLNVAMLLALAGCAGQTGTRSINIVAAHTKERVQAVYWKNGDYDDQVMAKISHLFRDRAANETYPIDPKLIDQIYELLGALAQPEDTEVQLVNGYRNPARNSKLASADSSVARNSLHTKGQAADIRIPSVSGKAVAAIAKTIQGGGVAYYAKTAHIHVDTGAIRSWNPK